MRTKNILMAAVVIIAPMVAKGAAFDFENVPAGMGLPLDLTNGGVTAHFYSSGQGGFYVQTPQNTILFTPAGFSGNCLVPSSVFGADLHIDFSPALTNCSVLYAPQELACDSSARLRISAYMDGALVGASTTTADPPGTWPSATLAFQSTNQFNSVVVHYDAPPPTGGDYGTIFLVDNVNAVAAPVPPKPPLLQLSNTGRGILLSWPAENTGFTLEASSDLSGPSAWAPVTAQPYTDGSIFAVLLPADAQAKFFRLVKP